MPNSRAILFKFEAPAACIIILPTSVDPVKATFNLKENEYVIVNENSFTVYNIPNLQRSFIPNFVISVFLSTQATAVSFNAMTV